MLEIVLCEDNKELLTSYQNMLNRIIRDNELNASLKFSTTSAESLQRFIGGNNKANLFILDIELGSKVSGLEMATIIRDKFKRAYIVFITGHLEYVFQSFKVNPFNFLPKPVDFPILEEVLMKVYENYLENLEEKPSRYLTLKSGQVLHKVKIHDIVCLERVGPRTIIHLTNAQISSYKTLAELYMDISDSRFIRCHKSFVCNKDHILEYNPSKRELLMKNTICCIVGRKYKKEIIQIV